MGRVTSNANALGVTLDADKVRHLNVLTVLVTVKGMMPNLNDAELRAVLEEYDTIAGKFSRTLQSSLPTLTPSVPMALHTHIPRAIVVSNVECRATYAGQPNICSK